MLSYDRRAPVGEDDVPFADQARDALAATALLRDALDGAPVGLWAFSQGAWAAPLAAGEDPRIAFLVLVGAAAVSPADQMRYSAAETVRRAGHGEDAAARAAAVRAAVEALLRGEGTRADAQAAVDEVAGEPWFELLWLPAVLPAEAQAGDWADMDYDPAPALARVRCPVLLLYGDDDAVPVEASIAAWSSAAAASGAPLEVVRLTESTHVPTTTGAEDAGAIDPAYERALVDWLAGVVPD